MSSAVDPQASTSLTWSSDPTASRPAALIFHGMTSTPQEVASLGASLHHKLRLDVTIPLLSGHGSSIEILKRTRAETWLDDAAQAYRHVEERGAPSVVVLGVSFGSLLALSLAERFPNRISALVMLSPFLSLRSRRTERLLSLFSRLPDFLLDRLWTKPKPERAPGTFIEQRTAFAVHSVGATARAWGIRTRLLRNGALVRCPILALHDPNDHHLREESVALLLEAAQNTVCEVQWLPGAEHEMTIGPRREDVFRCIESFLLRTLPENACRER